MNDDLRSDLIMAYLNEDEFSMSILITRMINQGREYQVYQALSEINGYDIVHIDSIMFNNVNIMQ